MMGKKIRDFAPLPTDLSLEELVPEENFCCRLDRRLDLSFVRDLVEDRYAHAGRPSVDPVERLCTREEARPQSGQTLLLIPDDTQMLTRPLSMLRLSRSKPFGSSSWVAITVLMVTLLLTRLDRA
jgi:hypothetical protein